jgi:hypothetical protein
MGILSWLGRKTDEAVIARCKGHLMTTLAASDRDAAYFTIASTAVWALFERVFEEQIHDPVEYLIKLQSRIEMQGPDHAAAFSNQLLKSISDPRTPPTVVLGMSLIAAWIQLIGINQRSGGPIGMNNEAWKLLDSYKYLFLRMARQPGALSPIS